MFNQIGPLELGIVLVIVLLIFGPKRLPGLGKQLGSGMREFKDSITGKDSDDEDDDKPAAQATLASAEQPAAPAEPAAAPVTPEGEAAGPPRT
jgi:sec-independent protein translocase protein TatA